MTNMPLAPLVQAARQTLAEAQRFERLPDDYLDVSAGKFAATKRFLKQKLLNNFRRAYVDVAFRQQSALNQKLITVMNLLLDSLSVQSSTAAIAELQQKISRLEQEWQRERRLRRRVQRRLDALTTPDVSR